MGKGKKAAAWTGSVIFSVCFIIVVLISSFEAGAYGSFGFYEKEYEKYGVLDDLKMEMPDVMYVTKEMMSFLRGDRENLIVETTVDGEPREFFTEDEISHMEDVKKLFVGGLKLRTAAVVIMIILAAAAFIMKLKLHKILPRAFQYTSITLIVLTGIVIGLFASDFDKYFVVFHEIFFSQGNWMFDPDVSLMINMLPEGFFADIAARIGIIFVGLLAAGFAAATAVRVMNSRKGE